MLLFWMIVVVAVDPCPAVAAMPEPSTPEMLFPVTVALDDPPAPNDATLMPKQPPPQVALVMVLPVTEPVVTDPAPPLPLPTVMPFDPRLWFAMFVRPLTRYVNCVPLPPLCIRMPLVPVTVPPLRVPFIVEPLLAWNMTPLPVLTELELMF